MRHLKQQLPILLLLLTLPLFASAENSTRSGDYTVHHNALKSDFLSPTVATAYGLQRSKFRGMVNISVIKGEAGATGTPVQAKITIQASNLMGMPKTITLREVREQDAIYYIGDFPIIDKETVNFTLKVLPAGESRTINARFSQQFYLD
jgi:hypothetical protein